MGFIAGALLGAAGGYIAHGIRVRWILAQGGGIDDLI